MASADSDGSLLHRLAHLQAAGTVRVPSIGTYDRNTRNLRKRRRWVKDNMSDHVANNNMDDLKETLSYALRTVLFITIPAMVKPLRASREIKRVGPEI